MRNNNKLITSLNLHIFGKLFLAFGLSPPLFSKTLVTCQTSPRLVIFHSNISMSNKKCRFSKNFNDVIACEIQFGLLSKSKILTMSMAQTLALSNFARIGLTQTPSVGRTRVRM